MLIWRDSFWVLLISSSFWVLLISSRQSNKTSNLVFFFQCLEHCFAWSFVLFYGSWKLKSYSIVMGWFVGIYLEAWFLGFVIFMRWDCFDDAGIRCTESPLTSLHSRKNKIRMCLFFFFLIAPHLKWFKWVWWLCAGDNSNGVFTTEMEMDSGLSCFVRRDGDGIGLPKMGRRRWGLLE